MPPGARSDTADTNLFIGVAGWSHPDWKILLGSERHPEKLSELARLSDLFNLIEITSAYYHPPDAKTTRQWLAQVEGNPGLKFTARLWQKLVREKALISQADIRIAKRGLEPLLKAGRLGALIVSLSPSLRYSESPHERLLGLLDSFAEYPRVVEIQHESWHRPQIIQSMREREVGVAQVDQPLSERQLARPSPPPGRMIYFRLNGRNRQKWLDPSGGRDERYNYFYSEEERVRLVDRIKNSSDLTAARYLVLNNYPQGHALVNAMQLRHALTGRKMRVPETLLSRFPELTHLALPEQSQQIQMF